jgi:hypothetical protein
MICANCYLTVDEAAQYCPGCGKKLSSLTPVSGATGLTTLQELFKLSGWEVEFDGEELEIDREDRLRYQVVLRQNLGVLKFISYFQARSEASRTEVERAANELNSRIASANTIVISDEDDEFSIVLAIAIQLFDKTNFADIEEYLSDAEAAWLTSVQSGPMGGFVE